MALTTERIDELAENVRTNAEFACAIEAEVRKQDDALILQLVQALEAMQSEAAARSCGLRICDEAIALGRARLEGKP